jgi:hypothetical protein
MDIIAKIPPPLQLAGILHHPDHSAKINGAAKRSKKMSLALQGIRASSSSFFLGFILNYKEWRRYGVTQWQFWRETELTSKKNKGG